MQVTPQHSLPEANQIPTLPPPLKWAGGKRWLVPYLRPIWSRLQPGRLVEPFVGGMAVALGLRPGSALLNDTNPHLINFYKWLKAGLVATIEMENEQGLYYRHRERFNRLIWEGEANSREAASLFYYLNRTGFNGLCRFNSRGEYNVPFGRHKTITYTRDFSRYAEALAGWELKVGDLSEISTGPADFIYADPPYDVEFTEYSAGGFSWDDQVRLAHWLARLDNPIVASNQATTRILELYTGLGFDINVVDAPRMISRTGDRTPAKEMLATRCI